MPRKKSKPTESSWAAILQTELRNTGTEFPAGALTFRELREKRRQAGLTCGRCTVYEWIRDLMDEGKITVHDGYTRGPSGRLVRDTRYLLIKT